ncbi:AAA family ATPase [Candidatus Peregrinibacteria bacterium]|nr:AAA family ATPase [Candidatus Peregrinibacteria bacterium]
MDLVLFGIQGSGKGTIAKAVATEYGFELFEMGGELRKMAQEDSPLGKEVNETISAGHLVSDQLIMKIVENFLEQKSEDTKIIFDGIPRTMEQSKQFDEIMQKHSRSFNALLVDIPEEMAMKRLLNRRICVKGTETLPYPDNKEKCEAAGGQLVPRKDDNPESIKTRFKAYYDSTQPVIDKYKDQNKLLILDGTPEIPQVRKEAFALLEDKFL